MRRVAYVARATIRQSKRDALHAIEFCLKIVDKLSRVRSQGDINFCRCWPVETPRRHEPGRLHGQDRRVSQTVAMNQARQKQIERRIVAGAREAIGNARLQANDADGMKLGWHAVLLNDLNKLDG
jgi:hypothetical protein